jgi:hypothetical protein
MFSDTLDEYREWVRMLRILTREPPKVLPEGQDQAMDGLHTSHTSPSSSSSLVSTLSSSSSSSISSSSSSQRTTGQQHARYDNDDGMRSVEYGTPVSLTGEFRKIRHERTRHHTLELERLKNRVEKIVCGDPTKYGFVWR